MAARRSSPPEGTPALVAPASCRCRDYLLCGEPASDRRERALRSALIHLIIVPVRINIEHEVCMQGGDLCCRGPKEQATGRGRVPQTRPSLAIGRGVAGPCVGKAAPVKDKVVEARARAGQYWRTCHTRRRGHGGQNSGLGEDCFQVERHAVVQVDQFVIAGCPTYSHDNAK
jgi:hypothetical protein